VVLYSYGPLAGLPDGIEMKDAASVVPPERIVRHAKTKSPALFSNYFRYKLLERAAGYWIDCDLYCIRPLSIAENPVFGWQDRQHINGAVLRFDAGSRLLASLTALYEDKEPAFPWVTRKNRLRAQLKSLMTGQPTIAHLPWGSLGPNAITYLAKQQGQAERAQPTDVFYPLPWERAQHLAEAGFDLDRFIAPTSLTIHLWNEAIGPKRDKPDPGSFLARLYREADGGPPAFTVA